MPEKAPFKSAEGKQAILAWYDALLNSWPVPHRERVVDTSFGNTFLLEAGTPGSPIVLLFHGSCPNSAMWLFDMEKLSPLYHVFAVDILGEPGRSAESRPDTKTGAYALWIREFLDGLSAQKAILIGNSLGGWMALKAAAAYPDRVDKLVLIAPAGIVPARASYLFRSILYASKGEKGLEALMNMICGTDKLPPEVVAAQKLFLTHFNPRLGALPALTDAELSNLTMPMLYIAGEKDCTTDVNKAARRIGKQVKNAQLAIIPGNGHVIYNAMDIVMPFLEK